MTAPAIVPVAVPTLDELRGNPALWDALPREIAVALYRAVARLEADGRARLLSAGAAGRGGGEGPDRLLLVDDAAKVLSTSTDSLYSKWKTLPFAFKDPVDGKLKFSVKGIERYIQHRVNRRLT